jgi:dephospho-CoA kinase
MYVLAVTGGIGAGKSVVSRLCSERGAVVLDLDAIAKGVVHAPGSVRDRVVEAFGEGVLGLDGTIDDAALAAAAFADGESLRRLDAIAHPAVLREVMTGLDNLSLMEHPPRVVVLDVPLLVEAPALAELADHVLAISASEDVRLGRLIAKGMEAGHAKARIALQATDAERAAIAGTVIDNNGTIERLREALDAFWQREVEPGDA